MLLQKLFYPSIFLHTQQRAQVGLTIFGTYFSSLAAVLIARQGWTVPELPHRFLSEIDPPRRKLRMSLASFLSGTASVETRHDLLKSHLRREVLPMIELSLDDVTEWIRERLPAAFTARVIDQIVEKLEKDGVYSRNPSAGGAWSGTNFYAKEVPKDQKVIQAANAALLNGLAEKALLIAKAEFPEDPELQQARLVHKWAASPNTLIESLRKPDIVLVSVDKADKAVKDLLFQDIAASCEVKYTDSPSLRGHASLQSSEMALFCMWKQVNRCYYTALSLCGNQLLIFQHTRGGSRASPVIDIDNHPTLFISLLLAMSLQNSPLWLGYDPCITDTEMGRQVRLYGRGVKNLGDVVIKPVKATTFTLIRPIFMAYGLKGRGTRIWLVKDPCDRYYILKDCWLPTSWPNDITIHCLLQDKSREDPLFALEVRSSDDEAIFGENDEYHIFDNPLFDEPVFSTTALRGIPTLVCWDEVHRPDATGTLVPETTLLLLGHPPPRGFSADESPEDRQHLRAAFAECGISIAWFSCAREFFNAIMGALVGHFNGYVRRKVLQCDISDTNVWMRIPKPEPEFIVPDWPKDKGPGWYPKRTGLLGDWGYGEDFSGNPSARRDRSCVVTGTFPFQATQLMAWEGGLGWAGPFTGHSVQHDLEAFVWLMWMSCVNLDGPFNRRRFECDDYDKATHRSSVTKRIKLDAVNKRAASQSRNDKGLDDAEKTPVMPSSSTASDSITTPSGRILPSGKPPSWARPGLHTESPSDVAQSKSGLIARKAMFTSHLSPYFSKHSSVMQGFQDLIALFDWKEEKLGGGRLTSVALATNNYKMVIDIIKEMRDGIQPELDGPPSKEEIAKARKEISALLDKGNLETPLLGNQVGSSQSQFQSKKRSRNDDD